MKTPEQRFAAGLGPKDPITGCIEWTGGKTSRGYGAMWRDGKMDLTHRIAYELKNGPIPDGMKICHTCDNPPCCNEEHLFLGTDATNMADMSAKGRAWSKLTEEDVRKIRVRIAIGKPDHEIAFRFGVGPSAIKDIRRGKTWKQTNG